MNGKGELLKWLSAIGVSAIVGYYSAQATMQERVATLEAKMEVTVGFVAAQSSTQERVTALETKAEAMQFDLRDIKTDIRELLTRVR